MIFSYHTLHFFTGFIGVPTGHPQSWPNSGILAKGPLIRNIAGEWGSVSTYGFHNYTGLGLFLVYLFLQWWWSPNGTPNTSSRQPHQLALSVFQSRKYWLRPVLSDNTVIGSENFDISISFHKTNFVYLKASLIPPLSAIFSPWVVMPLTFRVSPST